MKQEISKEALLKENAALKKELDDLKLILETVTGHSDDIEAELVEKVHAVERLFQVISKTIPVPFIIVRKDTGDILFSNEYVNQVLELSAKAIPIKKDPELYKDPKDRHRFLEIQAEQGRVENFEVQMKKSDGTLFWAALFSQPIMFREEDCLLTVIYDLSERKKAEEEKLRLEKQLRQTQKMEAIGTLAGGIAHDFNNILAIIFGKLELARMMLPEKITRVRKNLNDALFAAERAKSMIKQILAFCHQREQERKPFRINSIVSEAIKMIKNLITANIEIQSHIDSGEAIILGDPTQIHQVLMNLCSNASYALQERGGIIEVTLKKVCLSEENQIMIPSLNNGTYIKLTVSDNGPGIDKRTIDRVFDPFFTTKAPGEGTGLGLSVVHGIIQSHGGTVTVESEPGKGAAFHCYFPLLAETETIDEFEDIQKITPGGYETILFVDDENDILEAYGEMLKNLGYQVVTQSDSQGALDMFQKQPTLFDMVITDNTMPNITGKALVREMLRIRPDIPIILSTGSDEHKLSEDLSELGIQRVIIKPFTQYQIASLIREVFDKKCS